jgi:tRNA (guanine-N7-)-methyltransferase
LRRSAKREGGRNKQKASARQAKHFSQLQNLIFQPSSIVEPLDLAELFPKPQPLEIELGCGDASFLAEYARRNPKINFIGVERLLGRIVKLDKKGRRAELQSLRGVRIESAYFLKFLLPPRSASAVHIYFPDPWPKKRHHKNRLINESFPAIAGNALAPDGKIYLRTDDKNYFQQMTEVFSASKNFGQIETPVELAEILTDFERDFNARGIKTLRAAYQISAQK